ncbi:hypothetical protein PG999_014740 [Apiospora kogelbergensis]|uniref:Uncharacterized protein n=1 Tax=Apiospora kogelbergensis TaxID=1337665 RepID=A0AAW0Q600_9PEZI
MSSPNAFPDRHHIHAVFAHFLEPKQGVLKFLEHVDDAVDFEVTGHSRFAGRWRSKQSYYDATWAHVDALLAAPGYRLQVPGGAGGHRRRPGDGLERRADAHRRRRDQERRAVRPALFVARPLESRGEDRRGQGVYGFGSAGEGPGWGDAAVGDFA